MPVSPTRSANSDRILRAYIAETKYECLRVSRTPSFALPMVLVPTLFYVFFAIVLGRSERTAAIELFILAGFAVIGAMAPGLFGLGVSLATERAQGLLTLKAAMPAPRTVYVFAKLVTAAVCAALAGSVVMLVAVWAGKTAFDAAGVSMFLVVMVAGALPFCAVGLAIGLSANARSAPAIVNLFFLPMIYLSGILIPLPPTLRVIQQASPAYHLGQITVRTLGGAAQGDTLHHVALLAAVTACALGFSIWRFSRIA